MAKTMKDNLLRLIACVAVSAILAVALAGCGGKDEEKPADPNATAEQPTEDTGAQQASTDPITSAADLFREPSMKVQNIVNAAKTWDPLFRPWWGKIAPDFTLTDVDGTVHKLSDYRGKNVIILIWRTTNATCALQVAQLKELRAAFPDKDLAILMISNEDPGKIKAFAAQQGIAFTQLTAQSLEAPYGEVMYAPASFFVGPEGRFKVVARGHIPAAEAKSIVQAQ